MSIGKSKTSSGTTGILEGLKDKKYAESAATENIEKESKINIVKDEPNTSIEIIDEPISNITLDNTDTINNSAIKKYTNIEDELERAKELIEADEEPVRRTFTIDAVVHTELNELKVYVLPAVTGKKKWGYNDIVNIAIREYYERQKKLLQEKLTK